MNSVEKTYADKIKELEKAEEKLKLAFKKARYEFLKDIALKFKINVLCNWVENKIKS